MAESVHLQIFQQSKLAGAMNLGSSGTFENCRKERGTSKMTMTLEGGAKIKCQLPEGMRALPLAGGTFWRMTRVCLEEENSRET